MTFFNKIFDKLFIKQWNIGLARADIRELIKNGHTDLQYHWLSTQKPTRFFADPFIFKTNNGHINLVYEDYDYYDQYGKIAITTLDSNFNPISSKEILDTKSHLSYPNVFIDNGITYIIPEASKEGGLYSYEFDHNSQRLVNRKMLIEGLPLLDSTILHHNNKYWLFATHRGPESNNKLYIYHAPHWSGPYSAHQGNPVKNDLNGSRPAGNFICVDGEIYRPTQNCGKYYGKSVTINKITSLNEFEFAEVPVLELCPPKNTNFNYAIHTINSSDDVIVIDGLRRVFKPFEQIRILIKKNNNIKKLINPLINLYTTNEYFIPQLLLYME